MLLIKLLHLLTENPLMFVITIFTVILPLLMSIVIHEVAHGYAAYKFGDPTPKVMGRLTLNPLKHLDPLGTIMLFTIGIGWAKPVMINILNIPNRTQQMLVALAGPFSNILIAFLFTGIIFITATAPELASMPMKNDIIGLLNFVVAINLILAIFNMIPIPPLDGSRFVSWLLPESLSLQYNRIEPYGIVIMILLLYTVGFDYIFKFATDVQQNIYSLLGIQGYLQ